MVVDKKWPVLRYKLMTGYFNNLDRKNRGKHNV